MSQDTPPASGQPVHVRYTKWGGRPHWEYDQVVLGRDAHGIWTAGPAGTHMSRPGFAFDARAGFVNCFSHSEGWVATFWSSYGEPAAASVYVDITTVPEWSRPATGPAEVTMVDLDLDVIRLFDGRLLVDDEDEFAEHQVRFGYPPSVVADAEATCRTVHRAMEVVDEPFGTVGAGWLRSWTQPTPG